MIGNLTKNSCCFKSWGTLYTIIIRFSYMSGFILLFVLYFIFCIKQNLRVSVNTSAPDGIPYKEL